MQSRMVIVTCLLVEIEIMSSNSIENMIAYIRDGTNEAKFKEERKWNDRLQACGICSTQK